MKSQERIMSSAPNKDDRLARTCFVTACLTTFGMCIAFMLLGWSLLPQMYSSIATQVADFFTPSLIPHPTNGVSNADAIAGVWSGSASGGSLTFEITITIKPSCSIGSICGTFDIPVMPCSGTFTLIAVAQTTYSFQAGDKQGVCGEAYSDTLTLLSDDTLLFSSKGDWGESKGVLQRVK